LSSLPRRRCRNLCGHKQVDALEKSTRGGVGLESSLTTATSNLLPFSVITEANPVLLTMAASRRFRRDKDLAAWGLVA
jgi:hypothetical protein